MLKSYITASKISFVCVIFPRPSFTTYILLYKYIVLEFVFKTKQSGITVLSVCFWYNNSLGTTECFYTKERDKIYIFKRMLALREGIHFHTPVV